MPDPVQPAKLQIFLCHSSGDKPKVRELYLRLKQAGFKPWLDREDLMPGQRWQREIPKAVRNSQVVLVCLSANAVSKAGYLNKEITFALDIAEEQPEDSIFLIPVRLEECNVPERLSDYHWVDYFEEDGYAKLLGALHFQANLLGITVEALQPEPPAVAVPSPSPVQTQVETRLLRALPRPQAKRNRPDCYVN